jgi:hypothetical protein
LEFLIKSKRLSFPIFSFVNGPIVPSPFLYKGVPSFKYPIGSSPLSLESNFGFPPF